mgnify:CR=1 FL=1
MTAELNALSEAARGPESGRTVTRADLAEAVYRRVGLSRAESAELVQSFLEEICAAAERGDFTIGGRVPVNPSGGLESKGHPIGATGLGQIAELVTQLRGEAGARQVEGAKVALQENGGGQVGYEEAVVTVNLFTR